MSGISCLIHFLARKAKSAGKSALKNIKKAVGIPTGPISEANPRYYMVISSQGALVRRDLDLASPELYSLRFGDVVTCAEIVGRRARIIDPVEGWVSLVSSSNESLFELTFPPEKRVQVRTMERRFEKLKLQQASTGEDASPVTTAQVQRTCEEESSSVSALKSKIVFKLASSTEIPVPRLGAIPKLPSAPSAMPTPVNDLLLDFSSPPTASTRTPELAADPFSLL